MLKKIIVSSSTLFGLGHLSKAPGTLGSFVTVLLLYGMNILIPDLTVHTLFIVFLVLSFCYGVYSSSLAENKYGHDAGVIIIDEVVGQLLVFVMLTDLQIWHLLVGFVLFRFFDIVKPLGISKIQSLPSGWGIMIDDVVAGLYALFVLQVIIFILGMG